MQHIYAQTYTDISLIFILYFCLQTLQVQQGRNSTMIQQNFHDRNMFNISLETKCVNSFLDQF